jgi:hypothetical protein
LRPGEARCTQGSKACMSGRWLPGSDTVFLAVSIVPVVGAD